MKEKIKLNWNIVTSKAQNQLMLKVKSSFPNMAHINLSLIYSNSINNIFVLVSILNSCWQMSGNKQ